MPVFQYEAKDETGAVKKDSIEAPNMKAAQQKLYDQKYSIINLKEKSSALSQTDVMSFMEKYKKVDEQAITVF